MNRQQAAPECSKWPGLVAMIPLVSRVRLGGLLVAVTLLGALGGTSGCRPAGPTDGEMRAAVERALGQKPPASCRLLGFRSVGAAEPSCLWVLRSDEPLQLAPDTQPHVRSVIPVGTLQTIVRDVAQTDMELPASPAARCDYLEWNRDSTSCRLRQARADDVWYVSLETIRDAEP